VLQPSVSSHALWEPQFTIFEFEPWVEEQEDEEEVDDGYEEQESVGEDRAAIGSFGLDLDDLGDLSRHAVGMEQRNSLNSLQRSISIRPQSQDKGPAQRQSLGTRVVKALRYAADTVTRTYRRPRAHAVPLPADIHVRPSVAQPLMESPRPVCAWAAMDEVPLNAASSIASLSTSSSLETRRFTCASIISDASSSSDFLQPAPDEKRD